MKATMHGTSSLMVSIESHFVCSYRESFLKNLLIDNLQSYICPITLLINL